MAFILDADNVRVKGCSPILNKKEDDEIKKLAETLRGLSDKEKLANVLEWMDKNIAFWFERWPLSALILRPFFAVFGIFLFLSLAISLISGLFFPIEWWYFIIILGMIPVTTLSIVILNNHCTRKIPLKQLRNVCKTSIPIDAMIKNKLGVCRDYAKLTACLLTKLS